MTIEVTDEHILLLQRMYVDWADWAYDGAPAVNIKRPYGNSWVWGDVSEILGIEWDPEGDMPEEVEERCKKVHEEMADVMQVLVQNPTSFGPGTWVNVHPGAPYAILFRRKP